MSMNDALIPFALVGAAELADKSRLVGLMLVALLPGRAGVFWGMTAAYAVLGAAAVFLAHHLVGPRTLFWLEAGAGVLFVGFGIAALAAGNEAEDRMAAWIQDRRHHPAFGVSFLAIMISEMGDRTQIMQAAFGAQDRDPWMVYAGSLAALALLNALTVAIGRNLTQRLPVHRIRVAGAWMFIVFGAFTIFQLLRGATANGGGL